MRGSSRQGSGASSGKFRRRATQVMMSIIAAAISRPGTTPPRKRAPTEVPETSA